ncbi:hypothetical protein [Planomicrobium okeanokoites]|uniref:Uncharacterized protein n=1 Tax=Planomicrobium okeanokoites TaxID=244 RepID=A0ABV7KTC7_PLAOK|nr:hypothetical protein [Planomicrobium okeanokoites]
MEQTYGLWHKGINPSNWMPDYEDCNKEEVERWKTDLEKEKEGLCDFEGFYGIGIYEY